MNKIIYFFIGMLLVTTHALIALEQTYNILSISNDEDRCVVKMNNEGVFAGKFCPAGDNIFWSNGLETHTIATETDSRAYPCINNLGQVAGLAWEKNDSSWNSCRSLKFYLYDPHQGLVFLGVPEGWKKPTVGYLQWNFNPCFATDVLNVVGMNDRGQILVSDHKESPRRWAVWDNGRFKELDFAAKAINNESDILGMSERIPDRAIIYNLTTQETMEIPTRDGFYPHTFNDKRQVCGFHENEKKGFLWSPENGLVSLGDFVPWAINNNGQMVGMKQQTRPFVWIDGQLTDMRQVITKVEDSHEKFLIERFLIMPVVINDRGQILVMINRCASDSLIKLEFILLDPSNDPLHSEFQ